MNKRQRKKQRKKREPVQWGVPLFFSAPPGAGKSTPWDIAPALANRWAPGVFDDPPLVIFDGTIPILSKEMKRRLLGPIEGLPLGFCEGSIPLPEESRTSLPAATPDQTEE